MSNLFLPSELVDLEGHLKWFDDLLPTLEESMVAGSDVKEYLVKTLQQEFQKSIHDQDGPQLEVEGEGEGTKRTDLTTLPAFANSLNKITAHILLKRVESAKKFLKKIEKQTILIHHNGEEEVKGGHLAVAKYLLEYMEHCVSTLEYWERGNGDIDELREQKEQLISKWDEVMKSNGSQTKATLLFFKASFTAWLEIDYEAVLQWLKKSIDLDPYYHTWYLQAYRTQIILRHRKNRDARVSGPSVEEHNFCQKAYQLCPNDLGATLNYAKLLKDELWCDNVHYWTAHPDKVDKCLEIFEEALEMAEEYEFHGDTKKKRQMVNGVKKHFADFLVFGRDNRLDRERGRIMLESCLETYPESTFVLHKLAKLYDLGCFIGPREKGYADPNKAKNFYRRALAADPGNKPCVFGYLKFLEKVGHHREMLEVIEDAIASYRSMDHELTFKIERGCVIWKYNPLRSQNCKIDACNYWLTVVHRWPDRIDDVCKAIKGQPGAQWATGIDAAEVVAVLEAFDEEDVSVNQFISKLSGGPVSRVGGKKRSFSNESLKSPADNDDNWRRK